jgi:hypothetical protein
MNKRNTVSNEPQLHNLNITLSALKGSSRNNDVYSRENSTKTTLLNSSVLKADNENKSFKK